MVGQGTTFRVYLPESETSGAGQPVATKAPPSARGRGETILLVEDDVGLQKALRLVLSHHGYKVIEAATGPQAIERWRQNHGRIDLLLTDMILPGGMDGRELVGKLQQQRPGLSVIVCTGYKHADSMEPFDGNPRVSLLRKPFDMPVMLAQVRRALDLAIP